MDITGYTKRSIADQIGVIDYNFVVTPFAGSGSGQFGLSGTNTFNFSIKNGGLYDTSGRFIYSYRPNQDFNISGKLGQTTYDVYVNNNLIELGQPINTGEYSWIYANTNNAFQLEPTIRGALPDYSISTSGIYRFSGDYITGIITNNNPSRAFRIFNTEIDLIGSEYSVSNFTTGDITGVGYFSFTSSEGFNSDFLLPVILTTNFGEIDFGFFISGNAVTSQDVYLSISPSITDIESNSQNDYTIYFANYPSGAGIDVSLKYVSGITGNVYDLLNVVKSGETGRVSGFISGIQSLTTFHTGIVSGLDPKTLINETGVGTGYISTPNLTGTGQVIINYFTTLYGFGTGAVTTDYLASGIANLSFTGGVSVLGSVLQGLAYNFSGTGDNPSVASGLVPVGTGYITVHPTGIFLLSSGLQPGDYISAYLTSSKVFSGPLSYNFNLTGIGYATGANISGIVRSDFSLNFEPAYYVFSKDFSGIVSGQGANTGNFNPALCLDDGSLITTGLLAGRFSWSGNLDCDNLRTLPTITFSGNPAQVFDSSGNLIQSNKVIFIEPTEGFFSKSENSATISAGGYTRTLISNNGVTPSGTGYFSGVISDCRDTNGIWRESPSSISLTSGRFYSFYNQLNSDSFQTWMTGSGNLFLPGLPLIDSGSITFTITGSGLRYFGFSALGDSIGGVQGIDLYLYKNNVLFNQFSHDGTADLEYYGESFSSYYEKGGLLDLGSGVYKLAIVTKQLEDETVSFSSDSFSGCESDRYLRFRVDRMGSYIAPLTVDVVTYADITARSGVNYSPVTGTIIWNRFDSSSKYFDVPIYDNVAFGLSHTFSVTLTNASGGGNGGVTILTDTAIGIILDDDSYGLVTGIVDGPIDGEIQVITGYGLTGSFLQIHPNICSPISTPIVIGDGFSGGAPYITERTSSDSVICDCPLSGNSHSGVSGAVLPPPYTSATNPDATGTLCGMLSTAGNSPTNGWLYVGNFCSNGCVPSIVATIDGSPPNYIETALIPGNYLPSANLDIGAVYTGSIFSDSSIIFYNLLTSGRPALCNRLHFFINTHCYAACNWTAAASGVFPISYLG